MILGFFSLLSKSRRDMARRMHLASPQALAGQQFPNLRRRCLEDAQV